MSILELASKAVHGDRGRDYGSPLDNHTVTANLWGAYLGIELGAEQVCMLNILQKISRTVCGRTTEDTLVDIAGYAANVEMIHSDLAELVCEVGE